MPLGSRPFAQWPAPAHVPKDRAPAGPFDAGPAGLGL